MQAMEYRHFAHRYRFRESTIFGEDGCEVRERWHTGQHPSHVGTEGGRDSWKLGDMHAPDIDARTSSQRVVALLIGRCDDPHKKEVSINWVCRDRQRSHHSIKVARRPGEKGFICLYFLAFAQDVGGHDDRVWSGFALAPAGPGPTRPLHHLDDR